MPVFFSCATYNNSLNSYYTSLQQHNYSKALRNLETNKFIHKSRNRLLYTLEAGKVYFLRNDPVQSNLYFNQADNLMESASKSAKDIALSNLVNPMMQAYRGEDHEQFMVHFYKALNYAALGNMDDAVVEARRITLTANRQTDKFKNKKNRYSKDAFALNLQGMIYEMAGDINNAFIAYRNAADIYLAAGGNYFGVAMPGQLKQDLLRTAAAMGFTDEQVRYEKLLDTKLESRKAPGGELVLFMEEGNAPVKEEKNFIISNMGGATGFHYVDQNGYSNPFPFDYNGYGISETKLRDIRTLRVAIPVYRVQYQKNAYATISANGTEYSPQLAQDINTVAVEVMKDRFLTELANAVARQLTKKLVEKGTEKAAEKIADKKDKENESDTEEEKEKKRKKREENAKAAGEVAGFLVNLANTLTEKADTRNWQSLPAYISYVRIPLQEGANNISINVNGKTKLLTVMGGKGLQMMEQVVE
jgi:hypothetical protein